MTVEVPQRFQTDRPVPGDPITRAEELIIKEARRRHRRRVMFTVGVATLVIAGLGTSVVVLAGHRASRSPASPLLARPGRPTPTDARCRGGDLQVVAVRGFFGMGQTLEVIGFRNAGRTSCTLHGYPLVVAEAVKANETSFDQTFCMSASWGSLIHATVGSAGGVGRPANRDGLAA